MINTAAGTGQAVSLIVGAHLDCESFVNPVAILNSRIVYPFTIHMLRQSSAISYPPAVRQQDPEARVQTDEKDHVMVTNSHGGEWNGFKDPLPLGSGNSAMDAPLCNVYS